MTQTVLLIDHADALGGAEHSLLLLAEHLGPEWQPHIVCGGGGLARRAETQGLPVTVHQFPRLRRSWRFPRDWIAGAQTLANLARAQGAVLLQANTVRAAFYTVLAARLAKKPFVWHMRDFWLSETRPRRVFGDRLIKRLLGRSAAAVIANSHAVAANLPCPTIVVHNGIPLEHFDPQLDGQPFRDQHTIPREALLVGMVGRLRPWKGQECFLRVAAQITRVLPNTHFVLVGGDPFAVDDGYARGLPELAAHLGLTTVAFSGQLDDVRPALAALDLFVHPGEPEPFGLVNVEAMAMALPVVAFAHGALPEIVVSGATGLLVPPSDEAALAATVVALLGNAERRMAMGRAGRQRAEDWFDARRMGAEIAAVFRQVTSDK